MLSKTIIKKNRNTKRQRRVQKQCRRNVEEESTVQLEKFGDSAVGDRQN